MDTTEFFLLDGIEDFPNDDSRRLVYADWLADRGDVRAVFLQIEIELQSKYRTHRIRHLTSSLLKLSTKIERPKWERKILKGRAAELILPLSRW